jgi:hypothetical protein
MFIFPQQREQLLSCCFGSRPRSPFAQACLALWQADLLPPSLAGVRSANLASLSGHIAQREQHVDREHESGLVCAMRGLAAVARSFC